MRTFWLCFVPMFVAVDALGGVPVFLALTEGCDDRRLRRIVIQSVWTAAAVVLAFLSFGPELLRFLGVTPPDFLIAGGLLLLALSFGDLLSYDKGAMRADPEILGAVPIGIPLIAGPAVLTTCVLLAKLHGAVVTGAAAVANIALAGGVFCFARPITRFLGRAGSRTLSKVASLLLAAIAVMLIRRGIAASLGADVERLGIGDR